jgi:hypothetical protein
MGLCKYCKKWISQCGVEVAHCSDRTKENHLSCDMNTGFQPFVPEDGLTYSRDYILMKWNQYLARMNK